ncbi:MAG: hypothetical protein LBQ47_00600, partial [Endomicrobium sp.]|nr:hypothetical protein [Endomicrobium sp.]
MKRSEKVLMGNNIAGIIHTSSIIRILVAIKRYQKALTGNLNKKACAVFSLFSTCRYISIVNLNKKKTCAIAIAASFLMSFIAGPTIAEAQALASVNEGAMEGMKVFSKLELPHAYGKITSSQVGEGERIIISIQDLHCHAQAQENISRIIGFFDEKAKSSGGLRNIYL